jgi:nucleotide-binding universal stress UspA family protein
MVNRCVGSGCQEVFKCRKEREAPQDAVISSVPYFDRVLLATDFSVASQAAFETALRICKAFQASLIILHVFEYADAAPPETGRRLFDLDRIHAKAQASLDNLVQAARRAGVTCKATMGSGMADLTILEMIISMEVDLAVLGTNALHGFERLVFGSTAEEVLRQASCPVLTVGPQAAGSGKTDEGPVVFATDFNLTTTDAIRYAASFCQQTKSPLYCLHVLPRTLAGGVRSHIIPEIMTEALQYVANESGTVIDPPVCAVAYGSEISNAVVDYAKQHGARLIVLGVRRASMGASHVPAHIAYRIIAEAPCPVLTVAFASQPHATLAAACL